MLKTCKILDRDQIKLLAVIAMTFNHTAHILMDPQDILYEIFIDIGYFTAMTMCFFLAEGYRYTHSKKGYARRLSIFALISEVPFVLATGYLQLNILFTLLICFFIFCVMDSSLIKWKKDLLISALVLSTIICDWAVILAIGAVFLKKGGETLRGRAYAYCVTAGIFWILNIPAYAPPGTANPLLSGYAVLHSFYATLGILASGVVTLVFYNGKRSEKHTESNKWFFYIYYPAHLLVLWAIGQIL